MLTMQRNVEVLISPASWWEQVQARWARYSYLPLLVPALILYLVFVVYPYLNVVRISFYNWAGIGAMTWAGLGNYSRVLVQAPFNGQFYRAVWHNVEYFAMILALYALVGGGFALLLNMNVRGSTFYKTLFFLPYTLSAVVIGFLWGLLLNPQTGAINAALRVIGLGALAKPWLGEPRLALATIVGIAAWHGLGFPILVFLAGLLGVPRELVESAEIDGANRAQTVWHILLPLLRPIYVTLAILIFIGAFNAFDLIFVLQGAQAGPFYSTDVLGTFFYRIAFGGMGSTHTGFGLGSAVSMLTLLLVLPAAALFFTLHRRTEMNP